MAKVCIVNFNIYALFDPSSFAGIGGAEIDLFGIAGALQQDHEVAVITGDWGQPKIVKQGGVMIYRSTKLGGWNYLAGLFKLWLSLHRVKADVYIASAAGPEIGIMAWHCRIHRRKFIYRTASDISCNGEYIAKHRWLGKIFRYGLEHASIIVTSVQKHQVMLKEHYPHLAAQIRHLNLGLSMDGHAKRQSKNSILWVSRCIESKNPDLFIDLAERFPEQQFIMICPRHQHVPELYDRVRARVRTVANVQFHDYVSFFKIQRYYDQAKIFVSTSDFEGFTYTLLQSGLGKTPVVYLHVNPDEVLTRYDIGYFAADSMEKLVGAVGQLLKDKQDWGAKSINIFQYVRENHDMAILGEEWRKMVQTLAKPRRTRRSIPDPVKPTGLIALMLGYLTFPRRFIISVLHHRTVSRSTRLFLMMIVTSSFLEYLGQDPGNLIFWS